MSKRENDANNVFRPSDSPLTEHEKEQIARRKNMERLKAELLAREAANPDHSPKPKNSGKYRPPMTDGPQKIIFAEMREGFKVTLYCRAPARSGPIPDTHRHPCDSTQPFGLRQVQ
jgi:hypothetical protein